MTKPLITPFFVGRNKELATLRAWITSTERKPILISGMAGMGKTALVARFVDQHYASNRVAWLSFYSEPDSWQAIETFFRRIQENKPEVIVLDDIEQVQGNGLTLFLSRVQAFLPNVPIILTSRYSINLLDIKSLVLGALSSQEAINLLKNHIGSKVADSELSELTATLGNHPLALEIVSGFAKNKSIRELINELQSCLYEIEREIPKEPEFLVDVIRPKIINVTDLLIERLRKHPEDIYYLPPRRFEELVATLLEDMGWDVHLTKYTKDGGRDILAYLNTDLAILLCLVEAKRYNPQRPVGVELVRNLYGTLCDEQANSALLVTTSYFTIDAKEFQKRHVYQIGLKDYHDLVEWINKYKGNKE